MLSNPPYYAGRPDTAVESAFLAGDWPERLASGLGAHLTADGQALVVLSSDGAEQEFLGAFTSAGFAVDIVKSKDLVSEIVTLYRIHQS